MQLNGSECLVEHLNFKKNRGLAAPPYPQAAIWAFVHNLGSLHSFFFRGTGLKLAQLRGKTADLATLDLHV